MHFGADPDILVGRPPAHIGTNKLPKIITAMREAIIAAGGEDRSILTAKMTDITVKDNSHYRGIQVNDTKNLHHFSERDSWPPAHSARDIFYLLHKKNISHRGQALCSLGLG